MKVTDGPPFENEANRQYASDRIELLETIREIVAQEVDRRLKGRKDSPRRT